MERQHGGLGPPSRKESNLAPIEFPIKLYILFFYEPFCNLCAASVAGEIEWQREEILNSILMDVLLNHTTFRN